MGYSLVRVLLGIRPEGISHPAYLVLVRMSWTALDKDKGDLPARTYYAGWVPLAMALGYPDPPEGQPLDKAAERAVARAIAELTEHKLVSLAPDEFQRARKHRVYLLQVGPLG